MGDHAALERLADAYRATLQVFPAAPSNLPPAERLRFVRQVFREAGYDYDASLIALAAHGDVEDADQRDLADLLLLPTRGLSNESLATLYHGEGLQAMQGLRRALKP